MQVLIKKAHIIAPQSSFHLKNKDILIEDGIIKAVDDKIELNARQVITANNLHISAGWLDVFADFCDPGYEYKEDLKSGCRAAAAGGFTEVMIIPNTYPNLQSKPQIEYILHKTIDEPVTVYPIGAISKDTAGMELAEMYEMKLSGAVAFSDGIKPVQSSGLLLKALQYVKPFYGTIIQVPDDTSISHHGLMHEGIFSTRLGMPGKPAIAEEILIRRDLELAQYTDSHIHFTGISTRGAVELIANGKSHGISVSCSVTPHHLTLTDELLRGYDTNLKVNPPVRSMEDVTALKRAVKEGIIDCIATHHQPQNADQKIVEFEYAKEGMIGLESCFGIFNQALHDVSLENKINMLTTQPRNIFHLSQPEIKEGALANLTIFDPEAEWIFEEKHIRSKSKNSPFVGKQLTGKVIGIINNKKISLNQF